MRKGLFSGIFLGLALLAGPAAADDPGVIRLGAAVSLTGKYSSNGAFTRKGYDLAAREDQRGGRRHGLRQALSPANHLLRRRVPAGARRAACRAADPAGQGAICARALFVGPHRSHRARHREIRRADGRGQRRGDFAFPQELPLSLRRAFDHRRISARRRRHRGAALRRPVEAARCDGLRERSLLAGCARGRPRRHEAARHEGGGRRQAAAGAQRHVGDLIEGQGAPARPAADFRPRQGRLARDPPDGGPARQCADAGADALRFGAHRRKFRPRCRICALRRAMGVDADL